MRRVFLSLLCLILIDCSKTYDLNRYLSEKFQSRMGKPELFTLNDKYFSIDAFKTELLFERRHLNNNFTTPTPKEMEAAINNYIEETVLLNEVTSKVDMNSPEARAFMWSFMRKAAIAYYLEKESGAYDIVENYDNTHVTEKFVKDFFVKNSERYSKKDKSIVLGKLKNSSIEKKWQQLYQISQSRKQELMGDKKYKNKVKIVSKELYNPKGYNK